MKVIITFTVILLGACSGIFSRKERASPNTVSSLVMESLNAIAGMDVDKDCTVTPAPRAFETYIGKKFGVSLDGDKIVKNEDVFAQINCSEMKRFLTVILIPEKMNFVRFLFPQYDVNEDSFVLTKVTKLFPSEVYDSRRYEWTVDYPVGKSTMFFIFSKYKPDFLKTTVKKSDNQILLYNEDMIEFGGGLVKKIRDDLKEDKASHFIQKHEYYVTETQKEEPKESQ